MNISELFFNGDSFFHKLDASIKLVAVIVWTAYVFIFQDIRVFTIFIIVGFILLKMSKIPNKFIKAPVIFILIFTIFNSLFLLVITPQYGSELTGTYTYLINTEHYKMTQETLFYILTMSFKYFALIPITLLFVFTTHPTKFACSLNRIGVNYKIAYSVNLALRYIPTVAEEMYHIKNALMIKGINIDDEPNKMKKLKLYLSLLIPLIKSSIEKIETISNAMDLRSFGYHKKRTWYRFEKYQTRDYVMLAALGIASVFFIFVLLPQGRTFYYPF